MAATVGVAAAEAKVPNSDFDFQSAFDRVHNRLDKVVEDVTETRTKVEMLTGNGQPGKIKDIEDDIEDLKEWKNKSTGVMALVGSGTGILGVIGHFLTDWLRHPKH